MKVALVYDRITKWGGAERVLLALHELFPDAPLFTTVYDKSRAPWASVFTIKTSFLQHIPFLKNNHELIPFLSAIAFEQFRFDSFDVVISVTSAEAKGSITRPGTLHICYCLTPTRYLWSHYHDYFRWPLLKKITAPLIAAMREWDQIVAARPDHYIAISSVVKNRIKKYYRRQSTVIYPPVELRHTQTRLNLEDLQGLTLKVFLIVSRLVSYKKIDIAIQAFNDLQLPLVIIGTGKEEQRLKKLAKSNISFISSLTDEELSCYYKKSRAFIMPQEEDFGLAAVEAQAHGIPVIAYKKGGALDTVIENKTGIFFEKQTKDALINAIMEFQKKIFRREDCIENAWRFNKERFRKELLACIKQKTK